MHKEGRGGRSNDADLISDKSLRTALATSNRELEISPSAFSHRGFNETLYDSAVATVGILFSSPIRSNTPHMTR